MTIALMVKTIHDPSLIWMPEERFNNEFEAMTFASTALMDLMERNGYNLQSIMIKLVVPITDREQRYGQAQR